MLNLNSVRRGAWEVLGDRQIEQEESIERCNLRYIILTYLAFALCV